MARFEVILRDLSTDRDVVRTVSVPYEAAVLPAALGGYTWPFTRADVRDALLAVGPYVTKPDNQRYQLMSIVPLDDPFAKPRGFRRARTPDEPDEGDMDRFLGMRDKHE